MAPSVWRTNQTPLSRPSCARRCLSACWPGYAIVFAIAASTLLTTIPAHGGRHHPCQLFRLLMRVGRESRLLAAFLTRPEGVSWNLGHVNLLFLGGHGLGNLCL